MISSLKLTVHPSKNRAIPKGKDRLPTSIFTGGIKWLLGFKEGIQFLSLWPQAWAGLMVMWSYNRSQAPPSKGVEGVDERLMELAGIRILYLPPPEKLNMHWMHQGKYPTTVQLE